MTVRDPKAEYGPKYPGIPIDLVSASSTVVTLRSFQDIPLRGRRQLLFEFNQAPGHYLYVNVDELEAVCAKVDNDDALWIGAPIPLIKEFVPSKRQGKAVEVWKIPTKPGAWESVMDQYTKAKGSSARSAGARK